jgi:hypothetical protein
MRVVTAGGTQDVREISVTIWDHSTVRLVAVVWHAGKAGKAFAVGLIYLLIQVTCSREGDIWPPGSLSRPWASRRELLR